MQLITSTRNRFVETTYKYFSAIILLLLVVYNIFFTRNFVSWITFSNLFTQASKIGLVAIGMTFVIATGGIDISVGSTMAFGAIIAALFLVQKNPIGFLLSLIATILMGALAGVLIARFAILPMVATLALRYIMRGLAKGISGKGTVTYIMPDLTKFFLRKFLFIFQYISLFLYLLRAYAYTS